jgi:acetyl esterase/lipase
MKQNYIQKLANAFLMTAMALSVNAAQAAGSAGVEKHTQTFLQALQDGGGTPLEKLSVKEARNVLIGAQKSVKLAAFNTSISHKTIEVAGQDIQLKIVRPKGANGQIPVFMFFHGGGWVLGDFETHERLISDLVTGSGAAAVYVNYAPSPEAQYPTAINQAYEATLWVAQHGKELNLDTSKLAVVGNSVGGNMAAVVSLMAKQKGAPFINFQLLLWPVTDANFENASYQAFANGHFLTQNMMQWFWNNYTTDPKQRNEIYASPLRASLEQLKGLPPALIQTAQKDVLRDEGEAYGAKLDAAGVDVTVTRYNGMIHDFGLLNVLKDVPAVRSAMLQASAELKRRFVQ